MVHQVKHYKILGVPSCDEYTFFVAKETITTISDKTTLGTTFTLNFTPYCLWYCRLVSIACFCQCGLLPLLQTCFTFVLLVSTMMCRKLNSLVFSTHECHHQCFLNCYDQRTNSITTASHDNLDALFIYGFKGIPNSFRLSVPAGANLDKQLSFPIIHFLLVAAFRLPV